MALEPTKHVNGRMWPPGVSGNPNGRPVGSRTAFSHGFLKDLAEVWQEHGRDTMLHTAKTQPATFFEAPNECAIYLLRSSLRQTSCWVSAITGGTGPKITGPQAGTGFNKMTSFWWVLMVVVPYSAETARRPSLSTSRQNASREP